MNRPGQLAGNSEKALGIFFSLLYFNFSLFIFNIKPLSVEKACLLGIQNEIQAVCAVRSDLFSKKQTSLFYSSYLIQNETKQNSVFWVFFFGKNGPRIKSGV